MKHTRAHTHTHTHTHTHYRFHDRANNRPPAARQSWHAEARSRKLSLMECFGELMRCFITFSIASSFVAKLPMLEKPRSQAEPSGHQTCQRMWLNGPGISWKLFPLPWNALLRNAWDWIDLGMPGIGMPGIGMPGRECPSWNAWDWNDLHGML